MGNHRTPYPLYETVYYTFTFEYIREQSSYELSPLPPPPPPPYPSTLDGVEVKGSSFKQGLKELMEICTLCNDSGLAYNEVCM